MLYQDDVEKNIYTMPYDEPYEIGNESKAFFSWLNILIPSQSNSTPKVHYKLIDHMMTRHKRQLAVCHRGMAKSTLVGEYLPLYIASLGSYPNFGKVDNLVIFSATIDQAQEHLANILDFYEKSPKLQTFLKLHTKGKKKPKVDEIWFTNVNGDEIVMQAIGAGQAMRGTKKGDTRPQLLIFDDIMTDDILTSELERKKLHSWFYSSVARAVDVNHFKFLVIGTPMTQDDLLWNMWQSEKWHTLLLPLVQDMFTDKEDIVSSWMDRFTPEIVWDDYMEAKSMGALGEYYREMLLQVTPQETRVFQDEWFHEISPEVFKKNMHNMNYYTTMDYAVSEKASSDYRCIITMAVDRDGVRYIVRINYGRWNPSETVDILFQHFRKFRPISFKAEKAALQQVLGHYIEKRMIEEGTYVMQDYLELNSKSSKHARIMSLQPLMKQGKIKLIKGWYEAGKAELLYEMKGYTVEGGTTKHDDVVDTLANFNDPNFILDTSSAVRTIEYEDNTYIVDEMIADSTIF